MKASGWSRVRSLAGGIDAWSEQVDPEVPRYR
jgi:rhodanese-related sulfurtransferase